MVVPHLFYHDDGGADPSSAPPRAAHFEGPPPNMRQAPSSAGAAAAAAGMMGPPGSGMPPHGHPPPMFRGMSPGGPQGMSMNQQNLMFSGAANLPPGQVGGMYNNPQQRALQGYGYSQNPAAGGMPPVGYLGPGSAAAADSRESILAAAMATNPQGYSFGSEMQDLYEQQQQARHSGGPMGMNGMNPVAGMGAGGMQSPFGGQGGWPPMNAPPGAGGAVAMYEGMGGALGSGGQPGLPPLGPGGALGGGAYKMEMFEGHPGMQSSMMYNQMGASQQPPLNMPVGHRLQMQMTGQGPGQPPPPGAQYGGMFSPQQQQQAHSQQQQQQQQMMMQVQQYGYGEMALPQQQAQLPPMPRQKRRSSSISSNEDDSGRLEQQQQQPPLPPYSTGGPQTQQSPLPQVPTAQHQRGFMGGNPALMAMQQQHQQQLHYPHHPSQHPQQMQQMQPMGSLAGQAALMYGAGGPGVVGGGMLPGMPYAPNTAPMVASTGVGGVAGGGPDGSALESFGKRKEKKRRTKTFPEKLLSSIIEHAADEDAVAWLPDGKSFVIVNADLFVNQVLRPNFKECKYASFVRKLHRWGFVRLTSGTGTDCFHHPFFQKGRKDLVAKINCMPREKDNSLKGAGKPPSLAGVERFIRAKAAAAAAAGGSSAKGNLKLKQIAYENDALAEPLEGGDDDDDDDDDEDESHLHHQHDEEEGEDDSSHASEQQQASGNTTNLQTTPAVYSA